jgi:5-methylcytosine-specific restriction enzyme subunit McrC
VAVAPLKQRIPVTEQSPSPDVLPALEAAGVDLVHAEGLLTRLSGSLRQQFRLRSDESPIEINHDRGTVTISNLAGVLRLAPGVELDVAPKFLGQHHSGWRTDFLAIANLTGQGRILPGGRVSAAIGDPTDLASLIGRTFVAEYLENQRIPLRVYRTRRWRSEELEGELDLDGLAEVGAEGIPQITISFDRANPFNAVIARAARVLLSEVRDPAVRNQVAHIYSQLPRSLPVPRRLPPMPSRHRRWAPLVELSQRIIAGFDVSLKPDHLLAPGFLVRTWQAWERLTFLALRSELGDDRTAAQHDVAWANRGTDDIVYVRPDIVVDASTAPKPLDAKYKARLDRRSQRISQADLMEASAFIEACGHDRIVLLYPRLGDGPASPCGTCTEFDRVEIGTRTVIALNVEVRGVGNPGGYRAFASALTAGVLKADPSLAAPTLAGATA